MKGISRFRLWPDQLGADVQSYSRTHRLQYPAMNADRQRRSAMRWSTYSTTPAISMISGYGTLSQYQPFHCLDDSTTHISDDKAKPSHDLVAFRLSTMDGSRQMRRVLHAGWRCSLRVYIAVERPDQHGITTHFHLVDQQRILLLRPGLPARCRLQPSSNG